MSFPCPTCGLDFPSERMRDDHEARMRQLASHPPPVQHRSTKQAPELANNRDGGHPPHNEQPPSHPAAPQGKGDPTKPAASPPLEQRTGQAAGIPLTKEGMD